MGLHVSKRLYRLENRLEDNNMKTNFIRKATPTELIPQDEFVIEKEVVIDKDLFECFIKDPLNDYDFIKEG